MVKNYEAHKFEDAVAWLRDHGFDVLEPAGTTNRVFLKKNSVSAAIEKEPKTGAAKVFASPGYLVSGEISKLIDRGYQKFLKTSKTEVPATADHLKAIQTPVSCTFEAGKACLTLADIRILQFGSSRRDQGWHSWHGQ